MFVLWWIVLAVFVAFSGFTLYCVWKENFFKFLTYVWQRLWGIQVTLDLFIGILLFHIFVYAREGLLTTVLWLVPSLIFGNIVTLIYVLVRVLA